jgi:ribosomal protein L44E
MAQPTVNVKICPKCNEEKKHKGCYWKNKMIEKNLIVTKRRFKVIDKISFTGYVNFKKFSDNKKLTKKLIYINGYLCEELVSEINTKVSVKN